MFDTINPDDIEWIVNDTAELGVKIHGRCFFMYKGRSLEYEKGLHDNGEPMLFRSIGKREFGETVCPISFHKTRIHESPYTQICLPGLESDHDPRYDWRPINEI